MSYTVAITGKGGTGKTTIAGLFVTGLVAAGRAPVLAVDADPNSCLDAVLGVNAASTVGSVREEARDGSSSGALKGMARAEWIDLRIAESLVEADGFDLIAMGRPEGPGCYCYANNVLKDVLGRLASNYPYTVIDNEAGLENLSRRIVRSVDLLVLAGDPSRRGLETVKRLYGLAVDMKISYKKLAIIINRLRSDSTPPDLGPLKSEVPADFTVFLPDDAELAELAERGGSMWELSRGNRVAAAVDAFLPEVFS
ncbi:MAG TPA: AAA family ATPase [Spirochaetota bacterium]|nr:MAG: CobQ/CobB/MinD/ParA nucleotide binding domain protein [Spirochaetes bacterium ADurb.BinA120]HPI14181.1 AAA family ATPase [Spirochaetota bacterium]HPO44526.1 AAA family ATPase [Spirochaetota bacterium]